MESKNKGFSLIELLVSITILTIIMIPILDNIVMSSRINRRSRERQNATMLAGNLLETSKLETDVSSMAQKLLFGDPSIYRELIGVGNADGVEVEEVEREESSYKRVQQSCLQMNEDESVEFLERADRTYSFAMKNLTYNNSQYDAVITYDGSAYAKNENDMNCIKMPVITAIATKENAVITEGAREDWAASALAVKYQAWQNSIGSLDTINIEKIKAHMERAITISIDKDESKNKYVVDAQVEYSLDQALIPLTEEIHAKGYRSYQSTLFHSEFTSLKNLYYFYKPDLNHKSDRIMVKNTVAEDFGVYVVEQEQESTDYVAKMLEYQLTLKLEEPVGMSSHEITFYTNLGQEKGVTPSIHKELGYAGRLYEDGPVEKEEKTRLYEVTVAIYSGSSKQDFLEKDVLTTITSTKGVD